jgi:hypothetical protein
MTLSSTRLASVCVKRKQQKQQKQPKPQHLRAVRRAVVFVVDDDASL